MNLFKLQATKKKKSIQKVFCRMGKRVLYNEE